LLADNLSILNQGSLDSQSLVSQSSSESGKPTQTSAPVDTHSDNLEIAVISVAAARSQSSGMPSSTLVDGLGASLVTNELSNFSSTANAPSVPLATAAAATASQPA